MKRTVVLASLAALALVGCSKSGDGKNKSQAATTAPAPTADVPAAPAPAPAPAAPAAAASGPKAETAEYVVELQPAAELKAGAPTVVNVVVKPKGEWHFNLDFPTSVKIETTGAAVDKPSLSLDDAASKSEEQGATWAMTITPEPGAAEVTCNLKFAVCTETTCDPKKATVALKADVR